jgi:hypothetical protein
MFPLLSKLGIGIEADAASIGILASGISGSLYFSARLVPVSAFLSIFWYQTDRMPESLAFRHLKKMHKPYTSTL